MVDAYYQEGPLERAVIDVLNTVLPDGHKADGPDHKIEVGLCVVEVLPPVPGFTSMLGGPSFATANLQTSCVGRSRAHARQFGGLVRQALTERHWTGPFLNPIVWEGSHVDDIVSVRGYLETDKGINTWVNEFSVSYQAQDPPVLPSS